MEALLFGGNTATLHEGRVTQFGPTASTYRQPRDLLTAQVFSDPPINTTPVDKRGNEIVLGDGINWPAGNGRRRSCRTANTPSASGRITSSPTPRNGRRGRSRAACW